MGDKIVFRPPGPDIQPQKWTITGITFQPYYVQPPGGDGESQPERRIFANFDDAQTDRQAADYNVVLSALCG